MCVCVCVCVPRVRLKDAMTATDGMVSSLVRQMKQSDDTMAARAVDVILLLSKADMYRPAAHTACGAHACNEELDAGTRATSLVTGVDMRREELLACGEIYSGLLGTYTGTPATAPRGVLVCGVAMQQLHASAVCSIVPPLIGGTRSNVCIGAVALYH